MRRLLADPRAPALDLDDPLALAERRAFIKGKPFLRAIYEDWYAAISAAVPTGPGAVVELGSGGGFLSEWIPDLVTSEVQFCSHVRVILDGQALPFRTGSVKAVVMTDVLHHVPDTPALFREAARCVRPGGRLVCLEPWVTWWSRHIYGRLHHEPFDPQAATWEFPRGGPLSAANMALPWIIFHRDRARFEREFPAWRVTGIEPGFPLRYLVSGGMSMRALSPAVSVWAWRRLESLMRPWSSTFGMFALIQLERKVT